MKTAQIVKLMLLGLVVCAFFGITAGSSGDESAAFRTCVQTCTQTGCLPKDFHQSLNGSQQQDLEQEGKAVEDLSSSSCSSICLGFSDDSTDGVGLNTIPWELQLMQWDCPTDCAYLCMWALESTKPGTNKPIEKYFGKWPFVRILGMQEPASVVLSLLNMAAVLHCLVMLKALAPKAPHCPYTTLWRWHLILSSNAWLWSSIFHCRDTKVTEKFDYFSAGAVVVFNLYLTVIRTCNVTRWTHRALLGGPLALFYLHHMQHMSTVLFDYGWHVGLCVAAGAIQSVAWLIWAWSAGQNHPGRPALLLFVVLVNAAVLFEILDFPPIFAVLDAHALWHATTAPLAYLWFRFIKADVESSGKYSGELQETKAM